jgi:hypothetical protein
MSKLTGKNAEDRRAERVQLLVRVPRVLHRALKHAGVNRDTTVNNLVKTRLSSGPPTSSGWQKLDRYPRARERTRNRPAIDYGYRRFVLTELRSSDDAV